MSARYRELDARLPQADRLLLEIAMMAEPFSSHLGQPFFALPLAPGARQVFPIRSGMLRQWLLARYYNQCGEPPPDLSLRRVIRTLEARAICDSTREPVFPRIAWLNGNPAEATVVLYLGTRSGEFVAIHSEGWQIVEASQCYFDWRRGNLPLPTTILPPDSGPLSRLRSWLHCDEAGRHRCLLWLAAALRPAGPYPVLILEGPPSSGKSTSARTPMPPRGPSLPLPLHAGSPRMERDRRRPPRRTSSLARRLRAGHPPRLLPAALSVRLPLSGLLVESVRSHRGRILRVTHRASGKVQDASRQLASPEESAG